MAQHDYNLANNPGSVFRADANDVLGAIVTNNSGSSEPSPAFAHQWWFDTTTSTLKQRNAANTAWIPVALKDSNGWRNYLRGALLPAVTGAQILTGEVGTKAVFQQTNAPIGWTKDTTHNNKAFRVVSGTAASGGNDSFTTVFGTSKTTLGHALTNPELPSLSHGHVERGAPGGGSNPQVARNLDDNGNDVATNTSTNSSDPGGSSTPHSHNLTIDLQYVDLIIAVKD